MTEIIKMEHYNKTNRLKNFVKRTVIGITLVGLLAYGNCAKKYEHVCEIYQGWIGEKGKIHYVFDPKPRIVRVNKFGKEMPAKYILRGENSLRNSLDIGERYCFEVKKHKYLFWEDPEIKSIREGREK